MAGIRLARTLLNCSVERETGLGVRSLSPTAAVRTQHTALRAQYERDDGSPEKRAHVFERVPEKPRSLKKAIGFNSIRSAFFYARVAA